MPYYITTPIYYVNDRPHIGHCYTTLLADIAARFERRLRPPGEVFFLTGTDEHADKVVTRAAQNGMSAIQWADQNAAEFQRAFAFLGTSHDDFIRTTQDRHKTQVVRYVSALMKSGAIYSGAYEGWYDENQEEYLTETVAKEAGYKSPVTGKPLAKRREPCYFFRLSAFQDRLVQHFREHPECVRPESRRNEVLGRLREGLNDVPISRPVTDDPATQFGIRVPGDDKHRIYVWIDALFNYLSVVDTDQRRKFWPPSFHVIAKDILWFHAVIWPAMLLALRDASAPEFEFVSLPRTLYCHSYWVREGKKMSKSLDNFVTIEVLQAYATRYGLDSVRWYLATQGPLGSTDADFSHDKFVEVYNAELANGIGNCASRVGNMVDKYFAGVLPAPTPPSSAEVDWPAVCARHATRAVECLREFDLAGALTQGTSLVREVDGYINATAPFKLAKTIDADPAARTRLATILFNCAEAVRVASMLLEPALIQRMPELWSSWSWSPKPDNSMRDLAAFAGPAGLQPGQRLGKGEPLFMRADPGEPPPA